VSPPTRAQSEVVGVILLVGVVVVIVGVVGAVLFSDAFGGEDRRDLVSVESDLSADAVRIEHAGGKSYDASEVDVVLTGNSTTRLALSAFDNTSGDRFDAGSEWQTSVNLSRGEVRLFVVHRPSGTGLHEEAYFVDSNRPSVFSSAGTDHRLQSVSTVSIAQTVFYSLIRNW